MLRARIHNLITDQRYSFTAPDQAAIDARLAAKLHVYGQPEDREVVVEDMSAEEAQQRIDNAWAMADAICLAGADHNSRGRYLAWLVDPACSPARKAAILAVQDWMDTVWMSYQAWQEDPAEPWVPPTVTCPYTFRQIYQIA